MKWIIDYGIHIIGLFCIDRMDNVPEFIASQVYNKLLSI